MKPAFSRKTAESHFYCRAPLGKHRWVRGLILQELPPVPFSLLISVASSTREYSVPWSIAAVAFKMVDMPGSDGMLDVLSTEGTP